MKITFRDIAWIGVVTLIVVWLSKCHRDKTSHLETELINRAKAADSLHAIESMVLDEKLKASERQAAQFAGDATKANSQLEVSLKTINRLSAAIKAAKDFPIDTSFVTVSPEYVVYCDSLAINSEKINDAFLDYKTNIGGLLITKDTIIAGLKETINHERNFSMECRKEYAALEHYFKSEVKTNKPYAQIFAGAELLGTKQSVIQNVGAVLSFKTKSNKLWQISSGLQNNGNVYARVSGSILISFKK